MKFGKLNSTKTLNPPTLPLGSEHGKLSPRHLALCLATALLTLTLLSYAINPKCLTFSWWFGTRPETPYMVGVTTIVVLVLAYSNWREARKRQHRHRQRLAANAVDNSQPFTPVWPEWCTEYGRSNSDGGGSEGFGGDCDGGDGGGGD